MRVRDEIMHFRKERARELQILGTALEKNIQSGVSSPIETAVSQLKNPDFVLPFKDGSVDRDTWGYEIDDFELDIPNSRHIAPNSVDNLKLNLSLKVIANCADWDNLNDPLRELSFRVKIKGLGDKTYYSGFHIDRHPFQDNDGEVHPIYHLQYVVNPNEEEDFAYGNVLSIDTPRVMHYPLEFVLGIGYLTSNFFPTAYQLLLEDGHFVNLYKGYQERFWKPYSHTLATYWKPYSEVDITWNPLAVCPFLV